MLSLLGFVTVILMLVLIMTKKASPAVALIIVPLITGIIACAFIVTDPEGAPGVVDFVANVKSLGSMVAGDDGLLSVAATGVMFIFSRKNFFISIMPPRKARASWTGGWSESFFSQLTGRILPKDPGSQIFRLRGIFHTARSFFRNAAAYLSLQIILPLERS